MNIRIILLFILLSACSKTEDLLKVSRQGYQTVNLTKAVSDVTLPADLWDKMEAVYKPTKNASAEGGAPPAAHGEAKPAAGGHGAPAAAEDDKKAKLSTKIEIPTQFMSLKVYLTEKTLGALGGKNFELVYGQGGGDLDLKEFVHKKRKSFLLAVDLDEEVGASDNLKVFYLSNAKAAKIDGAEYGAGCDKYMDITTFYRKKIMRHGVEVNSTDLRYLRVLAGSYFFVLNKNDSLYLAQLKIKDSRFKEIHCRI